MLRTALVLAGGCTAGRWACSSPTAWLLTRPPAASAGDLWISDVSPKGQAVMHVYEQLKDMEDPREVAGVVQGLDGSQKIMLKGLLAARSGQDRPITTTDPEVGDTVLRLYQKYKMLKDEDDKVLAWRDKMEYTMLKDIQTLIERDQVAAADAEAMQELDDDTEAEGAWEIWRAQFPVAAEKGLFHGAPSRREDIKYRFRRLKETMGIDSATATEIVSRNGAPMLVDPLFLRRTWNKMVMCVGREQALHDIVLKHPGALVVQAATVQQKIHEIKMGASVIGAFDRVTKMFR